MRRRDAGVIQCPGQMIRRITSSQISTGLLCVFAMGTIGLLQGPAIAQDERTTALVTIAEANAECLSKTGTMQRDKASSLADRFLEAKGVAPVTRQAVRSSRDFGALKADYVMQQGGCEDLVKALSK